MLAFPDVPCLWSEQVIRLLLLIVPMLALISCASDSASHAESSALQSEIRALREENAKLKRHIDQLEGSNGITRPDARSTAAANGSSSVAVPALTVVKLKPKPEPPPKIDVAVPVVEPAPEMVEEIFQSAPVSPRTREDRAATDASLDAEFARGITDLKTGNVSGGVARLEKFAAENPRHPKADNALYFSGVGLMGQADYKGAASAFERLISAYPAGDAVQDGMLKLAECRVRLKKPREARDLYAQVVKKYPGSAAASEAAQRLASLPP